MTLPDAPGKARGYARMRDEQVQHQHERRGVASAWLVIAALSVLGFSLIAFFVIWIVDGVDRLHLPVATATGALTAVALVFGRR